MVRKIRDGERIGAGSDRWAGVYAAVAAAVEAELAADEIGREPRAYGDWREELVFGASLEVPAYLLPRWARPRLEPGRPMQTALVSADDRVVLREETAADTVERLGL